MDAGIAIAGVAALIGDRARAAMLTTLIDGRARTVTELAQCARITLGTASGHLVKLNRAGLVALERQGRHRYYRLADPAVALALKAIETIAVPGPRPRRRPGPTDGRMKIARTCYDHLAGRLGVVLTDALVDHGCLRRRDRDFELTATGESFLGELGVAVEKARRQRRAFARTCLDWSERRPHLAGALGAALARHALAKGWVRRTPKGRALTVTAAGRRALRDLFRATFD